VSPIWLTTLIILSPNSFIAETIFLKLKPASTGMTQILDLDEEGWGLFHELDIGQGSIYFKYALAT
jgi:hypothetical protein